MTWPDALAWLYSTQRFGIKLGLENTRRLLDALGSPETACRFLHVAGTNGKGSVCAMLDAVLRAAGIRTGLYTSPHLIDFRERIKVDGAWIAAENAAALLTRIRDLAAGWDHSPTYFEIATAMALRHFADAGVDCAVLETGMGGRLDSTNAVRPLVSVLTPIALDHTQWLGTTLAEIASEKAGILKRGVPAVSAPQEPEVREVLEAQAREAGCDLSFITTPIADAVRVGLKGGHQRENAALALAAIKAAGLPVAGAAIAAGLAGVEWPGRFQELGRFVLDGAHNTHGIRQLIRTWREEFGDERPVVIFGALRDKDAAGMLDALAPLAGEFWFVPVSESARGRSPAELASECAAPCRCFDSLDAALDAAADGRRCLVTGSLFVVGEALELLSGRAG